MPSPILPENSHRKMNGKASEDGDVAAAAAALEWKFSQVFGERSAGEEVQEEIPFYCENEYCGNISWKVPNIGNEKHQ